MLAARAVFFDLDETLFDHSLASRHALGAVRGRHEALEHASLDELTVQLRRILDDTFPRVLHGVWTPERARAERLRMLFALYGASLDHAEAAELGRHYRAAYQVARRAVPGAAALLRALHPRVTVGIITNNFVEEQRDKLRCCKLDNLIDLLVTSEEVGEQKPAERIFLAALERAGCRGGEAVMVGDSWASDVVGARRLGMRAVWFNRLNAPCPDPVPATEIASLEPTEAVVDLLIGGNC